LVAEALRQAYLLYLRGNEAVQVVQIDASDLVKSDRIGTGADHDLLIPVWQGDRNDEDQWLLMADIAPYLGIDPTHLRPSEWLSCGSIPRSRYSAAWPVVNGRLYFDEKGSERLVELVTYFCGQPPDCVQEYEDSGRFAYDWHHGAFFEKEGRARNELSVHGNGVTGAGVGLNLAASHFALPSMFGHHGYLRGMIIMD
jgi:hypothetical protein